ncbi:MAG: hypothetical protein K6F58_03925 [Bacteroidales bacterium]|nr:hypothetical protein [Bacteroidales bacterium]
MTKIRIYYKLRDEFPVCRTGFGVMNLTATLLSVYSWLQLGDLQFDSPQHHIFGV